MKNLKKQLKKDLMEIRENWISRNFDEQICEIKNKLIDYSNETQDYSLEDYEYRFEHYDTIEDYVIEQIKSWWIARIPYLCGDVRFDDDYYIIDGYGNIENIEKSDVEERLDEIIEELEND